MEPGSSFPVHLRRTDENAAKIAALTKHLGPPAGLEGVLDNLIHQARQSLLPRLLGRAVSTGARFDDHDQHDERWWPQGITTSADASDTEVVCGGHRVLITTWYAKSPDEANLGSRLTILDLATLRYRHVLLVAPECDDAGEVVLQPVRIHAGGIVWYGPWLHIAATGKGFVTCRVDDIFRIENVDELPEAFKALDEGRRTAGSLDDGSDLFVLPVRFHYRAHTEDGRRRLRYSFLSLDRSQEPPVLLAGEYGRSGQSTRIARYAFDPQTQLLATDAAGRSWPAALDDGVRQMQGIVLVGGTYYLSVSQGQWMSGAMYVGAPGAMDAYTFALPIGPEDLSYWPSTDTIWSVSEHPGRRWIFAVPRTWFDQHRPVAWVPRRLPGWLRPLADRLAKRGRSTHRSI